MSAYTLWRVTSCFSTKPIVSGFNWRAAGADEPTPYAPVRERQNRKKVLIVGSGWAGLGAAHHLSKQGLDVTVLQGGYEWGPKNKTLSPDDVGIRGFAYPDKNIFSLVEELALAVNPFTNWMSSAVYSEEGLEVKFPIFQDSPLLPTPFGTLLYTQFSRLPMVDLLTSLPLMAAVIDFDNTDAAWRKYDPITARELLKKFGCSERLYRSVVDPMLQVGLFAPAEQCSAAATLAMMYYYVLAHQKNFDLRWCQGTVKDKIFDPWVSSMKSRGCKFLEGRKVTDILINEETGSVSGVVCGKENFRSDAVILAIGISTLQEIIESSAVLCTRQEFLKVLNLESIDLLTVKLEIDGKVNIPNVSNVGSGIDDSNGWVFFDLSMISDEYANNAVTAVEADFYRANDMMVLKDDIIVQKVMAGLSKCIKDFENVNVVNQEIGRYPKYLTHFFPGSYKYMMRGSTSFPNMFMAGDWVVSRHGSWSQEKSYVTGLEAANRVVDHFELGCFAKIIPIEEDEPHIQALKSVNRNLKEIRNQLPWSSYFLQ